MITTQPAGTAEDTKVIPESCALRPLRESSGSGNVIKGDFTFVGGWVMRRFRHYLLTTVAVAAFSASVSAADLAVRMPVKAAPPPPVVWSWAGPYIGINLGVAWNHAKFTDVGDPVLGDFAFPAGTTFWSPNKAGFTGGGQIGYNLQSGNLVYGLEADLNGVDSKTTNNINSPHYITGVTATTKLEWMATVRARAGMTVLPQTLIYVTGGAAFAHFNDSWSPIAAPQDSFSSSKTRAGWTVGGGVEYMLARNWTAKIEGLYADFGSSTVAGQSAFLSTYRSHFAHEVATVRGGLNWKW